ncbi:hypothetical protein [Nocardia wallacei]|uniref:hypothetical protein n=1 Tax=Nocardia wallacei TaxID=480035 RepID=UPI0024543C9A|nr:hypothetical protein [Nocardia wallacei]
MSARAWVERAITPDTGSTQLFVYLPDDEYTARRWLRQVLGEGVHLPRDRRRGVAVWRITAEHMIPLVGSMAFAYGPTKVRLEITRVDENKTIKEQCDTRCQNAVATRVWDCVCACGGKYHGNGLDPHSWYPVGRTTLVRFEKTQIEQLVFLDGQLPDVKKVPRPRPPRPVIAAPPPRLPRPAAMIRPTPPAPEPVEPPAPRTVIPAAGRFHGPGYRPQPVVEAPPPRPAAPVTVPVRRGSAASLVAAVLAVLAVSGGVLLMAHPESEAHKVTAPETVLPSATPEAELPPPPAEEPAPPPPTEERPAPVQPRFPAGCYPFQTGC